MISADDFDSDLNGLSPNSCKCFCIINSVVLLQIRLLAPAGLYLLQWLNTGNISRYLYASENVFFSLLSMSWLTEFPISFKMFSIMYILNVDINRM